MLNPCGPRVGSLYVHVPFCAQKCAYCAFYSEASSGGLINRYVAALLRELERVAHDLRPRTVFFGGGTPSLLNLRQWEEILRAMVFKSFDILRQAGFENVNLDLMFAIPGQTMAVWRETLAEALSLGSEHLSGYEVIYEEDTPLFRQLKAREFDTDEDLACAMYNALIEHAAVAGFHQYEVANFARGENGVLDGWSNGNRDYHHSTA